MRHRLLVTRVLLVPVAFLALGSHHLHREDSFLDGLLETGGLVLLLAAAGGRAWASAYLAGRKNRELVTTGPYSLVRNPLYLFSLLGFLGAGLAFESVTLALLFACIYFATHWPAMRAEERLLEELFGSAYRRYSHRVPRFIPRLRRADSGGTVRLDSARFSRALRECMAIPLVFVAAQAIEWAKLQELLPILVLIP